MRAAYIRIILRYLVGAAFVGSGEIGQKLAADPDLVMAISAFVGLGVEAAYAVAKRKGWSL